MLDMNDYTRLESMLTEFWTARHLEGHAFKAVRRHFASVLADEIVNFFEEYPIMAARCAVRAGLGPHVIAEQVECSTGAQCMKGDHHD